MPKLKLTPASRYRMSLTTKQFDRLYLEDLATKNRRASHHLREIMTLLRRAKSSPVRYVLKEMHGVEDFRAYSIIPKDFNPFKDEIVQDCVILFKNSRGTCAYINTDPHNYIGPELSIEHGDMAVSRRFLFTPHFFDRYAMRFGRNYEYSDIYNQFFFNNLTSSKFGFLVSVLPSRENDYKKMDVWGLCKDGLMLGQIHGGEQRAINGEQFIFQLNTYIDLETLTSRQDIYHNHLCRVQEYILSNPHLSELFPHLLSPSSP